MAIAYDFLRNIRFSSLSSALFLSSIGANKKINIRLINKRNSYTIMSNVKYFAIKRKSRRIYANI